MRHSSGTATRKETGRDRGLAGFSNTVPRTAAQSTTGVMFLPYYGRSRPIPAAAPLRNARSVASATDADSRLLGTGLPPIGHAALPGGSHDGSGVIWARNGRWPARVACYLMRRPTPAQSQSPANPLFHGTHKPDRLRQMLWIYLR